METNQKFYIFRTYSAGVFFGNKKFIPADVFYNDENQKGKTPVLIELIVLALCLMGK